MNQWDEISVVFLPFFRQNTGNALTVTGQYVQ